jgi:hypothetical protein
MCTRRPLFGSPEDGKVRPLDATPMHYKIIV